MRRGMDLANRHPSLFLPPPEVQLYNPYIEDPFPTPLDERGLVDARQLIEMTMATVEPGYRFTSPFIDDHHLQWPNRWYTNTEGEPNTEQKFRNLVISRMMVPRIFHNWVHLITEPPPKPDEEVMLYRIEAQNVAVSLFKKARSYTTLERQLLGAGFVGPITDKQIESRLMQRHDEFSASYERALQLPKEFQLINFEEYSPRSPEDIKRIRKSIGKYAFISHATPVINTLANAA